MSAGERFATPIIMVCTGTRSRNSTAFSYGDAMLLERCAAGALPPEKKIENQALALTG